MNGDDEEEEVVEDPKIQREMDEISKIKDESGIGKVIFQELSELRHKPAKPVDPWKASRVPSAKYEPRYHTRYQSPMFACKSCLVLVGFFTAGLKKSKTKMTARVQENKSKHTRG